MSRLRTTYFPIWLVLLGFFVACQSSDSTGNETVVELSPESTVLEKMRNQIDLGLAQKTSWQKHWAEKLGNFDGNNFEFVFTDSIDPMEMPEKNPILPDDPLFPYQLIHPEGNGTMDIYSYKVEAQEGLDHPFLNPDSEVIWYRADGMKERLLFMGPSGMFEDGMWLNANEFLVLGFFQEEEGFLPMVWIIDLATHKFTQFKMNKVAKEYQYESYISQKIKSVDLTSDGI